MRYTTLLPAFPSFLLFHCLSPSSAQKLPLRLSVLSQVVKLCRECLEKQENVLADTHLDKLRVLSVASEALSYLQVFSEAAALTHRMVEGYM